MKTDKIKTWFVTGASSGVGKELCKQLIDRGYNVISVARRIPEFTGNNVLSLSVDVTNPDMIYNAVQLGIKKFGSIDVLVNNAGISQYSTFEELTFSDFERVMNVNFYGAFNTMKVLLPHFRKNKNGTIVNNTSQCGLSIRSYGSAYCSSKHALEGLTGAVWYETRKFCRTMAVELGYFPGTEIAKNLPKQLTSIEEYQGIAPFYKNYERNFTNNLVNAVSCIIDTVEQKELPRRLMLGKDALIQIGAEIDWIKKDLEASKKMTDKCSYFNNDSKRVKFLGITVYKKKVKDTYTCYSFLGIPIKIPLKKHNND